jgi:lipid-A-disaccharide synthase
LAVVGVIEVLGRAIGVLDALETARRALGELRPDLFVPIDFPDFNFRLLPVASRLRIRTVYYISPQVWAWRGGRAAILRRHVQRMVVIFPFEEEFYRAHHIDVRWIGHPLLDLLPSAAPPAEERARLGLPREGPVLALLPGSRLSEIRRIAPVLRASKEFIDQERRRAGLVAARWVVGRAAGLPPDALAPLGVDGPLLSGVEALRAADLSLVASGTVTLEATLLGRPCIVVYRMNRLTYAIARRLVHVPHIAMANLLAGERLLPEFVQDAAEPEAIGREAERLLQDPSALERIRRRLGETRATLGTPGAAARAAQAVLEVMDG